jgi:hypothetical protein
MPGHDRFFITLKIIPFPFGDMVSFTEPAKVGSAASRFSHAVFDAFTIGDIFDTRT